MNAGSREAQVYQFVPLDFINFQIFSSKVDLWNLLTFSIFRISSPFLHPPSSSVLSQRWVRDPRDTQLHQSFRYWCSCSAITMAFSWELAGDCSCAVAQLAKIEDRRKTKPVQRVLAFRRWHLNSRRSDARGARYYSDTERSLSSPSAKLLKIQFRYQKQTQRELHSSRPQLQRC